ncbi:MAG: GDSL-type esterase/lipase family protein [Bacteroidota bacterium]
MLQILGLNGQNLDCLALQDFKIVVLGSSTAAGAGASSGDSTWVGRYRNYLQAINPNNQVVNLAQGGYNTYRLMPTGYQAPSGRPTPDPAKNITAGINENPDAIIINLPSNDVGSGFSVAEQLANFDTMVAHAQAANIPIWVCTTQPRNFSNSSQLMAQAEVRDSINAKYAPFNIDFWTTIATSNNTIEPAYNSGDGVHLNDAGHKILFERVRDTQIPAYLFVPGPYTDYGFLALNAMLANACGDSSTTFQFHFANAGGLDLGNTQLKYQLMLMGASIQNADSMILSQSLINCEQDSFAFSASTLQAGNYELLAILSNPNDTLFSNDTLLYRFSSLGYPSLSLMGDTLCEESNTILYADFAAGDTVFWYDDPTSSQIIGQGTSFNTPLITAPQTWYAQAIRGDLFYRNSLRSTLNSNINFNGTMFDLLPSVDMIVDSFGVKINTLGPQDVEIYYKSGSYQGSELDPTAWTLAGVFSVNVLDATALTSVPLGGLNLTANDTAGIYIQMANSGSRLSYQSVNNPQVRTTTELRMISGSGIAHDFSNIYYPRDWNGEVFYHFGERLEGECATERKAVEVKLSNLEISIGPDTLLDIADSLQISVDPTYISYLWSTGDTTNSIKVAAADFGIGIHYLSLNVVDSLLCSDFDQIVLAVGDLVGLENEALRPLKIYPNPTLGLLRIELDHVIASKVYDLKGQLVLSQKDGVEVDLSPLVKGIYLVVVQSQEGYFAAKVIKE